MNIYITSVHFSVYFILLNKSIESSIYTIYSFYSDKTFLKEIQNEQKIMSNIAID